MPLGSFCLIVLCKVSKVNWKLRSTKSVHFGDNCASKFGAPICDRDEKSEETAGIILKAVQLTKVGHNMFSQSNCQNLESIPKKWAGLALAITTSNKVFQLPQARMTLQEQTRI